MIDKPMKEWSEAELRDVLIYPQTTGHLGCDERFLALSELLKRERREAEMDGSMAGDILHEIGQLLAKLGCKCGPDVHRSTPPMMYPEWIRCVVHSAKSSGGSI